MIKDFVGKYAVDLVVVGSSRAGWSNAVLGSVAENIIRESPCPLLAGGSAHLPHHNNHLA